MAIWLLCLTVFGPSAIQECNIQIQNVLMINV